MKLNGQSVDAEVFNTTNISTHETRRAVRFLHDTAPKTGDILTLLSGEKLAIENEVADAGRETVYYLLSRHNV